MENPLQMFKPLTSSIYLRRHKWLQLAILNFFKLYFQPTGTGSSIWCPRFPLHTGIFLGSNSCNIMKSNKNGYEEICLVKVQSNQQERHLWIDHCKSYWLQISSRVNHIWLQTRLGEYWLRQRWMNERSQVKLVRRISRISNSDQVWHQNES